MERIWSGRFDGEDLLSRRLFQAVEDIADYKEIIDNSFFFAWLCSRRGREKK